MITINTTEKWLEFSFSLNPIKKELDKVWLCIKVVNKGSIDLGFRFGKIDTTEVEVAPAVAEVRDETGTITQEAVAALMGTKSEFDFYTQEFVVTLPKTNEEIKTYSFEKAHEDALVVLKEACKSKATFSL